MLELIWLKSEVVTVAVALFFFFFPCWPSLGSHRGMNHKQSHVFKMVGLLLQNVILCYTYSLCLLACMLWLNKTHSALLTYNSVKEKVNTNALPRTVTIIAYEF